ncbi:hypothetical protein [Ideonella sp. A 288]|uniref:hypothetical protein n=1 Tax=Ideonella sp. A 288 TaxID=1962181 RepID=UPI001F234DD8|nr:hypothetical protein [Ideonella sp. A 288]
MIRCVLPAVRWATAAPAIVASMLLAGTAAAQAPRPFPANALRGTLEVNQGPEVLLNGQPARLSPGSRIRGENNLLVLSGALAGQKVVVHYTLETMGMVHNVWILTAEEMSRKPWPSTPEEAQRWAFDPAAQVWTKR